jgi:hypothetical protein
MKCLNRFFILGIATLTFAGLGTASSLSFTGTFALDNDVQLFTFDMTVAGTVTFQTFGYGGGTNALGQVIAAGGFEPVLGVFDSLGVAQTGPLQPGPNPTCSPRNPDPARANFCQDVYAQLVLPVGSYIVSLSQYPNVPLGNLSAGFFYVDSNPNPNFNGGFTGSFGFPGNGNWALDISGVNNGSVGAPEPGSILLAGGALLIVIGRARAI